MAKIEIDQYTAKLLSELWDILSDNPVDIEEFAPDIPEERWNKLYEFLKEVEYVGNGVQ